MISYKKVAKYKYTKNPSDVVALKEYILYEDTQNDCRHAVLKFFNNLDQSLYGLQFEVYQYDGADNLIAKSLVVCDKFTAEAGTEFVPKAKLKLSINCESIAVKLITADFDRIRWEKGNFTDNSYEFKRYVEEAKVTSEPRGEQPVFAPAPAAETKSDRKKKKIVSFAMRDIHTKNLAKFPKFFTALVVVLVVAFTVASSIIFTRESKRFQIDDFDVYLNSDSTVTVMAYDGDAKNLVIPAKIGDYTVIGINTGAFVKSDIESIKFDGNVTVMEGAFRECARLKTVTSDMRVAVLERGFDNCAAVERVDMPSGSVRAKSFFGSTKLIGGVFRVNSLISLYEVIGLEEEEL